MPLLARSAAFAARQVMETFIFSSNRSSDLFRDWACPVLILAAVIDFTFVQAHMVACGSRRWRLWLSLLLFSASGCALTDRARLARASPR